MIMRNAMPADHLLARSIRPLDHAPIPAVAARDYRLGLAERRALLVRWHRPARLCLTAHERPALRAIAELTDQLELARLLSWRVDLSTTPKRPPAPSVKAARKPAAPPERRCR
jgi:hypothetical protein